MDPHELLPLDGHYVEATIPAPRVRHCSHLAARDCYQGPIRICRLLALLIFLPSVFIFVPLYLRYRVFSGQMYPMSMTDMRLIDGRISTTWCQTQVVQSNTTFNAFVVPGPPELMEALVPVSMTRQLELQDDMKEYWGFYLLKGSTVTVSTCVRWPGASLIMIKGYKHLHECAYIGDDSSEELDELLEANKLGLISNDLLMQKIQELKKVDGKANDPGMMKRNKAGVSFHDPIHGANFTAEETVPAGDVTEHDPKELRELLERLHALRQAAKELAARGYRPPARLVPLPALHRHRDANVARDQVAWLSFTDIDSNNSVHVKTQAKNTHIAQDSGKSIEIIDTLNDKANKRLVKTEAVKEAVEVRKNSTEQRHKELNLERLPETNDAEKSMSSTPDQASSKEIFEDVLQRLQALGDRGKRVLSRLEETMGVVHNQTSTQKKKSLKSSIKGSEEELDRLGKVLVEAIDEEKTRSRRQEAHRDAREDARTKRELMLGQIDLRKELNEDDEARDYAAEEGLQPDGYAEHHDQVNETTAFDMSNSEFWSSFSSSEEALLECDGLILNLPLTPHSACHAKASDQESFTAARANALTYRVPSNGYYFFVFNSENEVQTNFIKARFDLQKTRYDVARTTLRECRNSTSKCELPLDIFSSQKVVLEVPFRNNDSLWNEQFVIISECEPRTSIYLACVIAVPLLIMVFAFQ